MRARAGCLVVLISLALFACDPPPPAVDAGMDAALDADLDAGAPDAFALPDGGNDAARFDGGMAVTMVVYAVDTDVPFAQAFTDELPAELEAGVRTSADPAMEVASPGFGVQRIALVHDASIDPEGYRLEQAANGYVVRGGGPLGEQYGLAALLEAMDVRFFHPDESFVPTTLATPDAAIFGVTVVPEIGERGFMPWTLHPIESFFAVWEPSEAHYQEAERIIDWAVKNGADFFTYPALDNIARIPADHIAWVEHTQRIVDYAHLRGLRIGLGVQLFGGASLQKALTLVPTGATDVPMAIENRLSLFSEIGFDSLQLSFGEFSGEDPRVFIDTLNIAYTTIERVMPDTTVTATIHVGDFPSTHVTYMGTDLLYYFLVQYADSGIVPWVHSVMDFTLFEPVSGAYGHTEFSPHREYLFSRLAAHQPVSYNPEDAYWVTFDDSVPIYLPLYVRSRLTDLTRIRERATTDGTDQLDSHVIFSSGWEWGYWQNDWAVLHMTRTLPASEGALYHQMLDPLPNGSAVADIVNDLMEIEHRAFIDEELSAYTAGVDASFALGTAMGVWSEPQRPSFADIQAMSATDRATFRTNVLARLGVLRTDLMSIEARLAALGISEDDRWLGEIVDGVHVTRIRVDDAIALWTAAADLADGMDIEPVFAQLTTIEAEETAAVAHRLARFHAPNGDELVAERRPSALLYQYGYLRHANDLCYYRRERIELANVAHGTTTTLPNCLL
jgi:hypothetical protein